MPEALIVDAIRTPIGRAKKGSLVDVRPDDLLALVLGKLLERQSGGFDPGRIEDVIVGCAFPEGEQGLNIGRMVEFLAHMPVEVAGATVNRWCGSSQTSCQMASHAIKCGDGDVYIGAGVESMTMIPMGGRDPKPNERLVKEFPDAYMPMTQTAENVAREFNISREEQDEFALRSHKLAAKGWDDGFYSDHVIEVPLPNGETYCMDEGIRRDSSMEKLASLKPVVDAENGTVTAGNSAPLNDAAAAVLITSDAAAEEMGLEPMARVVGTSVTGYRPDIMGVANVPAVNKLLERAGLTIDQIDVVEMNEAFSSQSIQSARELGIEMGRLNIYGGALALGHPLGMSGARLIGAVAHHLNKVGGRYGVATMCVGNGQGIATLMESV